MMRSNDPHSPHPPKTVAILVLSREQGGMSLSDVYAAARRALERNTAYIVAPPEAIGIAEREEAIRECAGRPDCFAQKVQENFSGIDLLLSASTDTVNNRLILGLRLVDVHSKREIGSSGDEMPIGMSLVDAMECQLEAVVPWDEWGGIAAMSIETDPPGAEVVVGTRSCASPCELTRLPPGTYPVVIRKQGYEPWSGHVNLVARETARLAHDLVDPNASLEGRVSLWVALGMVVIATAVISYVLLESHGSSDPPPCNGGPMCFFTARGFGGSGPPQGR